MKTGFVDLLCRIGMRVVAFPLKCLKSGRKMRRFFSDLSRFRSLGGFNGNFNEGALYPCVDDLTDDAGVAVGDYFNQDLFVAQRIFEHGPVRHIDVGSRIDGFVAHVAAFREIEVLDIRPLARSVKNIKFRQCDFMGKYRKSFWALLIPFPRCMQSSTLDWGATGIA